MIKTSKNNSSDRLLPQLQKPKDEVRSFLLTRIQEGEEKLLSPIVSNQEKLDQLQHDYTNWKSYNEEYLKRIFTTDEISYKYSRSPYPLDVINHFRANAFLKAVENFKKEVKNNIGILEEILASLNLYEVQETSNKDIILKYVYSHSPSPVRFNAENIKELTGYDIKKDEEKFLKFLRTIDFLVEERYLRCPSKYVKDSMSPEPTIQLQQNVTITQYGIDNIRKTDESHPYEIHEKREQKSGPNYNITLGNHSNVNFQSTDNSIHTVSIDNQDLDMVVLAEEFKRLREALLPHAESAEQCASVGQIASAETAAKNKNESRLKEILSRLGPSAKWILNTAKEIGVPIAIKALEAHIK